MNQLNSLKRFTTIVADTSNIESICKYKPEDATTNPSLILQAVNHSFNECFINQAVEYAKKKGGLYRDQIVNASDKILVDLGVEILKYIPGYISSEVDARLSFSKEQSILKAKKIINLYEEQGISRKRVLIKLAATWECIKAAEELKKDNILCNLTLLFSFAQARACAESDVFLISPFVGRIYDWYISQKLISNSSNERDPGVKSVYKIYDYYKKHNYKTIIMGASFRNIQQILNLSGCDRLTISPVLLKELESNDEIVDRKLIPPSIFSTPPSELSEEEFRWDHNQDVMAVQKLSEGIRNFAKDQLALEKILSKKI
ncbi:transaldolase [Buchnera aphidicola]|uniref:Transaldolase n=1 Tax=Buchnera aphidicola str. USDA (Myzus persicae) TaxID=1009856 RepID=W0P0I9_BUCMP|nr:transaldolase [Buchnera aphidicola]AHG60276.1 Tala [Buchnera aphidicola str. USDA (Myzus persicae)]AHG60854.1 Tala [Buchnera aphidicola str. W106 (Myzus persicae)]AHG61426.1 Tala [Buchnera aphidicola str. G002 (Myzus persicae)]AHG61999.1 Tala [Buchnera aphidicola str. F009 (Myzus persicae)]WAI03037.1 MAG: transaldolase [Buchnera aphidicola (Myzus persicae)]